MTADQAARQRFQQGVVAYEAQNYRVAIEHFRAAYQLSARPEVLFNIGRTLQSMGNLTEALATYRQLLVVWTNIRPAVRTDVEARIHALSTR